MLNDGAVLIVDSEGESRDIVFASAFKAGKIPMSCSSYAEARSLLEQRQFNVIFCSDSLPDGDYQELMRAAKPTPVIILSCSAEWDSYLAALQAGAFDYIACPPYQAEADRILSCALNQKTQPLTQAESRVKAGQS